MSRKPCSSSACLLSAFLRPPIVKARPLRTRDTLPVPAFVMALARGEQKGTAAVCGGDDTAVGGAEICGGGDCAGDKTGENTEDDNLTRGTRKGERRVAARALVLPALGEPACSCSVTSRRHSRRQHEDLPRQPPSLRTSPPLWMVPASCVHGGDPWRPNYHLQPYGLIWASPQHRRS
mgnify:CR=1 FL=1